MINQLVHYWESASRAEIFVAVAVIFTVAALLPLARTNDVEIDSKVANISTFSRRWKYFTQAPSILYESYLKFCDRPFYLKTLRGRPQIILSSPQLIDQIANLPEDVCSFAAWSRFISQLDTLLPWHTPSNKAPPAYQASARYVKQELTNNLHRHVSSLQDEIQISLSDHIAAAGGQGLKDGSRITVVAEDIICGTVVRAALKELVGLPHPRDRDFVTSIRNFTRALGVGGQITSMFPRFLKPLAKRWLTTVDKYKKEIDAKLAAIVKERVDKGKREKGDYLDDILEGMESGKWDWEDLVKEFLITLFSSIFSTTFTNTVTLVELATRHEYQNLLRKEVEQCLDEEGGWTMSALDRMWKLESFMKESQRLRPMSAISVTRVAVKEFTLLDGTRVAPGTHIAAVQDARYRDTRIYPEPDEFDGLRFYRLRKRGEGGMKFTDLNATHFPMFGSGRHACPGRFFAATVSKVLLAQILIKYQISLGGDGKRPKNATFEEHSILPSDLRMTFTELEGRE